MSFISLKSNRKVKTTLEISKREKASGTGRVEQGMNEQRKQKETALAELD